jgi:uncharacterized protein (TIGR00369 family)
MSNIPAGFEPFTEPGTFIDLMGPVYRRKSPGKVELCLPIEQRHCNPMGSTHGGCLFTLMDITIGMNIAASLGVDTPFPTIQMDVNFIAAGRAGEIVFAEATVDRTTRTFAFAAGTLRVDDRLLIRSQAIFRYPPGVEPKR